METHLSLSELCHRANRGKDAILAMIVDGTLEAKKSDTGRREWQISTESARAAGLRVTRTGEVSTGSIDDALRAVLREELIPIVEASIAIRETNAQLQEVIDDLHYAIANAQPTGTDSQEDGPRVEAEATPTDNGSASHRGRRSRRRRWWHRLPSALVQR